MTVSSFLTVVYMLVAHVFIFSAITFLSGHFLPVRLAAVYAAVPWLVRALLMAVSVLLAANLLMSKAYQLAPAVGVAVMLQFVFTVAGVLVMAYFIDGIRFNVQVWLALIAVLLASVWLVRALYA